MSSREATNQELGTKNQEQPPPAANSLFKIHHSAAGGQPRSGQQRTKNKEPGTAAAGG